MAVSEIQAKSLLRKQKKIDSWFVSRYAMNLYRGCLHNCAYCDGRAEGYFVDGEFGRDVSVKINAPQLLDRELDPARKRKPMKRSHILVGGGVGDSYQPVDEKYGLTRQVLEVIAKHHFPAHVLTKSCLVERDLELLKRIHATDGAIVSMSFSTADDEIASIFEPGCSPPSQRLATLARFNAEGIPIGAFYMPVIPMVTDSPEQISKTLAAFKDHGVQFVVFSGMTLKGGRQQEHFLRVLKQFKAGLSHDYQVIYPESKWGSPDRSYADSLNQILYQLARKHGLPVRVPPSLYDKIVDENDRVTVILESLDYLMKAEGKKSPYGYAAWSVSKLEEPISSMRKTLRQLKGVGPFTERLIWEILDTGRSKFYESLLS